MSQVTRFVTHSQKVCSLYKKAVRELENMYFQRHDFRYYAVILRSEFDQNKDIKDLRIAKKLLLDLEEKLRLYADPQPKKFPFSPGGVAHERFDPVPDYLLDLWDPIEKAFYPKYFALREKRKKEYEEWYYKQYPDMRPKESPEK